MSQVCCNQRKWNQRRRNQLELLRYMGLWQEAIYWRSFRWLREKRKKQIEERMTKRGRRMIWEETLKGVKTCLCVTENVWKITNNVQTALTVMKTECSKNNCRQEDGTKPTMILSSKVSMSKWKQRAVKKKRVIVPESSSELESAFSDESDHESDWSLEDIQWSGVDGSLAANSNLDDDLHENMNVILDYEEELFPGMVTEILPNDYVRVLCTEKGGSKGSTWKWQTKRDEKPYPRCDIRQTNITSNVMPGTGRNVEFHVPELEHVWGKPIVKSLTHYTLLLALFVNVRFCLSSLIVLSVITNSYFCIYWPPPPHTPPPPPPPGSILTGNSNSNYSNSKLLRSGRNDYMWETSDLPNSRKYKLLLNN